MSPGPVKSKVVLAALGGEGLGPVAQHVGSLHACNTRLWDLEEAVRDRELPNREVVRLKRAIDSENLARHAGVAALDLAFDDQFGPQRALDDPRAIVNSESLGQMVDRLSVLMLKLERHPDPAKRLGLEARRTLVCRCFDQVVDALTRGDGVDQRFDEAKTYSA